MLEEQVLDAIGDNAFAVMGIVSRPLRRHEGDAAVSAFMAEATAGDYDELIEVCRAWAEAIDNDTVTELY